MTRATTSNLPACRIATCGVETATRGPRLNHSVCIECSRYTLLIKSCQHCATECRFVIIGAWLARPSNFIEEWNPDVMIKTNAYALVLTLSALCFAGCRSVLPPEQPSRLWDVYLSQTAGCPHPATVSIPKPTRMVKQECGPQPVFIPPLR
jgi:hypothetical protein